VSRVAFDHIAVGVHRIDDAVPFLVGELGGRAAGGGAARAFLFRQWIYGGGKLEVLEPAGAANGFMHRFLARRGPGVHHVTFEVPSLDAACRQAADLGFAVVERDESDPEWKEAFLHPKSSQSIVVQMVEHVRAASAPPEPRTHRPEPSDPEPGSVGIELIGLRLATRDLERARRLWCGLLGGIGRPLGPDLEVRWPGSVMRMVVRRLDGTVEEGPLAIELACLRPAVLPRGRHPILGTVFEPVDITELPPPPVEGETPVALDDAVADEVEEGEIYYLDGDALGGAGEESS
jgi:methylmalonyl-CoA/ethylmalonyl-CoA epimerase